MSDGHKQTPGDLAHRIGIWGGMIGLGLYVLNIGAWVGAADEKFNDAETVETQQRAILLQQATIVTEQKNLKEKLDEIEEQAKEDKREILDAIKEVQRDD